MTHKLPCPPESLSSAAAPVRPAHAGTAALPLQPIPPSPSPPPPPTLLARVGKYMLVLAGLCALVGAGEGALVGLVLAPGKDPTLPLVVALDRFLLLGLLGAGCGAVVGTIDWYARSRRDWAKR